MRENRINDSVYTQKVHAGNRRIYYFDVRQTKAKDYYITLTENTRKSEDGPPERHKIFVFKEDFNRFLQALEDTVNHVKNELLPNFDYEEFDRRQEEWEARQEEERPDSEPRKVKTHRPSDEIGEDDMQW